MKKLSILLSAFLSALTVSATTVPSSVKTPLSEGWQFLRSDLGSPWEAVRPVKQGNPESVPIWSEVSLPHCFNALDAVDPDVNYYQGPGWYRRTVEFANPYPGGRVLLEFEGAGQKTRVYVGQTLAGSHVGGYDGWCVDITDLVAGKASETVSVRCDNSRDTEMIPSDLSDFNVYGGLYRNVNLVYTPAVRFAAIRTSAAPADAKGKRWTVSCEADIVGGDSAEISATLLAPDGTPAGSINGKAEGGLFKASFIVSKPKLWSPDSPQLYSVRLAIGEFSAVEPVGLRTFLFEEKGPFYLNGERLLLRGTHRHEDHAGVAAAMTDGMVRTEMEMMKEMGVNFIRLAHYQQSEKVLDLCDSLGILVWEEIPWCRGGLGGDVYKEQARRMLRNMIAQHRNHPSVIIWGLGNENDWPGDFPEFSKKKIRAFMSELNDLAHSLDSSRKTAIRRCAFCSDIVDVYSPSIWAGWYRGVYTDYKSISEKEFGKVDRFLHVEWGGDSHAGRHSEDIFANIKDIKAGEADERAGDASLYGGPKRASKDGDWSESYIVRLIDWHLKEQETMPWLTGTAYWPFKDFSTPVRPENPVPYVNQKGVITRDFTKKESYYVFQSYWTDKPMVHIYGHSWPVRWGEPGEGKEILVYSNCETAELFLNGISQGVKTRNSQDFPAAGLRWICKYDEGANNINVVARKGKVTVEDSILQHYQTEKWGPAARLELSSERVDAETVRVFVSIVDKMGVKCLDSKDYIKYSVCGDGKLVDNQGTPDGSRYVQARNGFGSILVKTCGGSSIVGVSVDGVPTAFIRI